MAHLYDGETFEHKGRTFRVGMPRDEDHGVPWEEYDGHGVITEWERRDKAPGERVLASDRGSKRFYDIAATTKIARKDGWGCKHTTVTESEGKRVVNSGHPTKGEAIACAVECDYDHMRRWCEDQWCYIGVIVTLLDEDGEATRETESLWAIESSDSDYIASTAYELADEIMGRVEVENPDVQLSEN